MSDDSKDKTVGQILSAARSKRKENLDDISKALRIRASHLEALEQDDPTGVPGQTYAVGFIRSYAAYLGLDADDLIAMYKQAASDADEANLDFPLTEEAQELPSMALVFGLLVVVAGIYLFWAFLMNAQDIVRDRADIVGQTTQAPAGDGDAGIISRPKPDDEGTADSGVNGLLPSKIQPPDNAPPIAVEPLGEPAPTRRQAQAGDLPDLTATPGLLAGLKLRARGQTWVRVENMDGRVLYSSIILPGDEIKLPPDVFFILDTFDAGKLDFVVDDEIVGSVGEIGQKLTGKQISVQRIIDKFQ